MRERERERERNSQRKKDGSPQREKSGVAKNVNALKPFWVKKELLNGWGDFESFQSAINGACYQLFLPLVHIGRTRPMKTMFTRYNFIEGSLVIASFL
jgi:hypothetical protein